jgi:hypothetical protein
MLEIPSQNHLPFFFGGTSYFYSLCFLGGKEKRWGSLPWKSYMPILIKLVCTHDLRTLWSPPVSLNRIYFKFKGFFLILTLCHGAWLGGGNGLANVSYRSWQPLCSKRKGKKIPYFQRNNVGKVFNVQKTISKRITKFIILMWFFLYGRKEFFKANFCHIFYPKTWNILEDFVF